MFCSKCGNELQEQEKFCVKCGRIVDIYGGFWKRLFAFVVDYALFQGISFMFGVVFFYVFGIMNPQAFESEAAVKATQEEMITLLIFPLQIFFWLYCATMESQKGATFGKIALGIHVIGLNGTKISFLYATIRHFSKFLSLLLVGFGFFMIAITDRKQGLHDLIAKTLVVNR